MSGRASDGTLEEIAKLVAERLAETGVDGVVALRASSGSVAPHVFRKGDDLSELEINPKYPLMTVVSKLHKRFPTIRLAVVARGCDERAYIEMAKRNQIDPARLDIIGFACTADEAQECYLRRAYPETVDGRNATRARPGQSAGGKIRRHAAGRAANILEEAVREVHQMLRLPQHLPGMFLRSVRDGRRGVGGAGAVGPAVPHLSHDPRHAHGQPLRRPAASASLPARRTSR